MKKKGFILALLVFLCSLTFANNTSETGDPVRKDSLSVDVGADLVSRYIWRGLPLSLNANIQPFVSVSYGKFSFGAWGSYGLSAPYSEADLFVSYSPGPFTISVYDYYFEDENDLAFNDYGNFSSKDSITTPHTIEGSITFNGTENFPVQLTAAAFLYGDDKDENNKNYYSTYLEAAYPISFRESEIRLFVGGTINEGFYAGKAAVTNIGLTASHELHISESYSLPVYTSFIINPDAKDVFMVFGMTF